jgi:hypothetical protein
VNLQKKNQTLKVFWSALEKYSKRPITSKLKQDVSLLLKFIIEKKEK